MEIARKVSKKERDHNRSLCTIRLSSPECGFDDHLSLRYRFELLRAVCDSPDLIDCSGARFETLKVFYDSNRWVLEASAMTST